jgi:hypothetical protein
MLIGACFLIGSTIYGASQRAQPDAEVAISAVEIVLVLIAGILAVLAWRLATKVLVTANMALFALLTLLTFITLIAIVAGPTKEAADALADEQCKFKNLSAQQCDTIKQFTNVFIFVTPVLTFLYCACYFAVSFMYFRSMRRDSQVVVVGQGAAYTGVNNSDDPEGFDDFSNQPAAHVPTLNVSADVI